MTMCFTTKKKMHYWNEFEHTYSFEVNLNSPFTCLLQKLASLNKTLPTPEIQDFFLDKTADLFFLTPGNTQVIHQTSMNVLAKIL